MQKGNKWSPGAPSKFVYPSTQYTRVVYGQEKEKGAKPNYDMPKRRERGDREGEKDREQKKELT